MAAGGKTRRFQNAIHLRLVFGARPFDHPAHINGIIRGRNSPQPGSSWPRHNAEMPMRRFAPFVTYFLLALLGGLAACSTGRMAEFARDPQTGRRETVEYSKFYDAGGWLEDGKIGLQLAVTHEKKFVPVLYDVQKGLDAVGVPGALAKDDDKATGVITFYLVNLELYNRAVRLLRVYSATQESTPSAAKTVTAGARTQTRVDIGSVTIPNYGKELLLNVDYELDGIISTKSFVLKRRTDREIEVYFSRSGTPPYPWYQAPYYPFRPPLARAKG
jgi:hypothetical protein